MNVIEFYEQAVKPLSVVERLRLATLILNDIPPQAVVDYNDTWSDKDLQDFSRASWEYIDTHIETEKHA